MWGSNSSPWLDRSDSWPGLPLKSLSHKENSKSHAARCNWIGSGIQLSYKSDQAAGSYRPALWLLQIWRTNRRVPMRSKPLHIVPSIRSGSDLDRVREICARGRTSKHGSRSPRDWKSKNPCWGFVRTKKRAVAAAFGDLHSIQVRQST